MALDIDDSDQFAAPGADGLPGLGSDGDHPVGGL
jgi:hypothetical protein